MPRPRKCRKVCHLPPVGEFVAAGGAENAFIVLTVDEYECIRLVDYQGFSQEACAEYMQVSRATAQLICDTARKKLAAALVNGQGIRIAGGDYRLCDGQEAHCGCGGCPKHKLIQYEICEKGEQTMRIAVTYENEQISQHFGHTEKFKIYDVDEGKITAKTVVNTNGQGHGALAAVLQNLQVDALICGGIGGGAQMALAEAGIKLFGGVSGSCDAAVEALLAGSLGYNPHVKCEHHDHEHGDGSHTCGDHRCGSHTCGGHSCH